MFFKVVSILQVQRQVHMSLTARNDALKYIEGLILKLLGMLCGCQPHTVSDVEDRVQKTFPHPIDKWAIKDAQNALDKGKKKATLVLPIDKIHPLLVRVSLLSDHYILRLLMEEKYQVEGARLTITCAHMTVSCMSPWLPTLHPVFCIFRSVLAAHNWKLWNKLKLTQAKLSFSSMIMDSNAINTCHCFPCLFLGRSCNCQSQQGTVASSLTRILPFNP